MTSQSKRIFIIGQPGAGKALLAKTLAEKLGWEFIDADLGLEFRVGRTFDEILGNGAKNFHECQTKILSSQLDKENIVITTDASIVCDKKNFNLLSDELVVFLQVSLPVQLERVSKNPITLLPIQTKEFLENLHTRDKLYEQMASVTINSDDNDLEGHVQFLLKLIEHHEHTAGVTLEKKDLSFFHKKSHALVHLTDQQAKCLKLLALGKTSKEIARDLEISFRTVEGTIAKIMDILGCSSSKELIALYHEKI